MTNNLSKITTALVSAQAEMTGAKKNSKNPFFKSDFANLTSVLECIRDPFNNHGLAVTQLIEIENERMILVTKLLHVSGEFLESKMLLPIMNDPQKLGGLITYFRRYSLLAIASIPTLDDDGNEATKEVNKQPNQAKKEPFLNVHQLSHLEELLQGHEDIKGQILELAQATSFKKIQASRYDRIVDYIKVSIRNKEKKLQLEKDKQEYLEAKQ